MAILFIGIWIPTCQIFFTTLFINSLLQQQQRTVTDEGMNYNYLCFQWPSLLCLCILSPSVSQTLLVGASCSATICPLILSAALRLCSSVHSTAVPNVNLSVVLASLLTPYLVCLYLFIFFLNQVIITCPPLASSCNLIYCLHHLFNKPAFVNSASTVRSRFRPALEENRQFV